MSSTANTNRWSVRTEEGIAGPYTTDDLRKMARQGAIDRHTPIRAEGAASWIRAGQYPAIFSLSAPVGAPTPAAPPPRSPAPIPPTAAPAPPPMPKVRSRNSGMSQAWVPLFGLLTIVLGLVFLFAMFLLTSGPKVPNQADMGSAAPGESANKANNQKSSGGASSNQAGQTTQTSAATDGSAKASVMNTSSGSSVPPSDSAKKKEYSTEEVVAMSERSVVTVLTSDARGSGFMVAPFIVATNYHVIADDDGDHIKCFFPSTAKDKAESHTAKLVAEDPKADLALLRIGVDATPLELAPTSTFRRGQSVITIGTPSMFKGKEIIPNAVTPGVLSSEHQLFGVPRYQLSMAIYPGNSGGPVIGLDGNVVGVVVSKSTTEENIGFCVPASSLRRLMEEAKANSYSVSQTIRSEHWARVTAREMFTLTEALDRFLKEVTKIIEQKTGKSAKELQASGAAEVINSLIVELYPILRKNFSTQLKSVIEDRNLSPKLCSEFEVLQDRHKALQAMIDRPSGNLQDMMSSIENLHERFLEQLRKIDRLLPLGKVELE